MKYVEPPSVEQREFAEIVDVLMTALERVGHPTRLRILAWAVLRGVERPFTPVSIHESLGLRLGTAAYHVRVLCKDELITLKGVQKVRGADEHHYVLNEHSHHVLQQINAFAGTSEERRKLLGGELLGAGLFIPEGDGEESE